MLCCLSKSKATKSKQLLNHFASSHWYLASKLLYALVSRSSRQRWMVFWDCYVFIEFSIEAFPNKSLCFQHGTDSIKQVLQSNQTEQVPSNIQVMEHRYHSFAGVDNTNGIRSWFARSLLMMKMPNQVLVSLCATSNSVRQIILSCSIRYDVFAILYHRILLLENLSQGENA